MLSSIMSDCVTDESPNGSIIRSHSQGLYSQKLLSLLDVVNGNEHGVHGCLWGVG